MEEIYELLGFIKASRWRTLIIKLLKQKPMTPKEIQEVLKISSSYVSKLLGELEEKGIIRCANPNATKGRIYVLTEKGKEIGKIV